MAKELSKADNDNKKHCHVSGYNCFYQKQGRCRLHGGHVRHHGDSRLCGPGDLPGESAGGEAGRERLESQRTQEAHGFQALRARNLAPVRCPRWYRSTKKP